MEAYNLLTTGSYILCSTRINCVFIPKKKREKWQSFISPTRYCWLIKNHAVSGLKIAYPIRNKLGAVNSGNVFPAIRQQKRQYSIEFQRCLRKWEI